MQDITLGTYKHTGISSVTADGYQKFNHRKIGRIYVPVMLVDGKTRRYSHRWHRRANDAVIYGRRLAARFARMKAAAS